MESGSSPTSSLNPNELLSRFIVERDWIRADGTVRQGAFIPYPYPDLSVTRQHGLTSSEFWEAGERVGQQRNKVLLGSADIAVSIFVRNALKAEIDEPPRNHYNITGWPSAKSEQKLIALDIAGASKFVIKPGSTPS